MFDNILHAINYKKKQIADVELKIKKLYHSIYIFKSEIKNLEEKEKRLLPTTAK